MLICSDNRLIPTNVNMLVLESEDGKYFYVHRALYDQAVVLTDRYGQREKDLVAAIALPVKNKDSIDYFRMVVPTPINILGNFLVYVRDLEKVVEPNIENLCGTIHQMSMMMNFRDLIKMPVSARAGISFSLSIMEEYKLSWDKFFQESIPYSEDLFLAGGKVYNGGGIVNNTNPIQEVSTQKEKFNPKTWDYSKTPDFSTMSDEEINAYWEGLDNALDSQDSQSPTNEQDVKKEPDPKPEPVIVSKPKTGLDVLMGFDA